MLITIVLIFAFAAIGGVYLLSFVLQNKNTPKAVAFIHGGVAAIGIVLLILYVLSHHPSPVISLGLFILAALGGFTLMYRDIIGKSLPKWLVAGHGIIALLAIFCLILFAFF